MSKSAISDPDKSEDKHDEATAADNGNLEDGDGKRSSKNRWVVWEFCPQDDACEIPVPK